MTVKGCDYAFTTVPVSALTADGIAFACRYLSTDPAKNLTAAERDALHAAGISIVLVWETTGTSPLSGYARGLAEAKAARAEADALGCPKSVPIYYAVDFNATAGQMGEILDYLHGASDAEGNKGLVGPYGSYDVIEAAAAAGYTFLWQTYAWSNGQWASAATIRQTLNGTHIGGADVDLDEAVAGNYGQWAPAGTTTPPSNPTAAPSRPQVVEGNSGYWVEILQRSLMLAGQDPKGVDGHFGSNTLAAVEAVQSAFGIHRDGQCGNVTWQHLEARTLVVQHALVEHGLGAGGTDSVAGPATASELVAFQREHGLLTDGICGGHTSAKLGIPAV
jgi:peptidoglycan hydrolase-like protein with peptidoglycan-binding domain